MLRHRMHLFLFVDLEFSWPSCKSSRSTTITCLLDSIANDRLSDDFIVRRWCFVGSFFPTVFGCCATGSNGHRSSDWTMPSMHRDVAASVCGVCCGSVFRIRSPFVIKSRISILSVFFCDAGGRWDRQQCAMKIYLIIYYGCGERREMRIW